MPPTAPWLNPDEQQAWRSYRRLVLLVEAAIARDLNRDSRLSMPDYLVLSTLSEADGHRRRLTELAARMQWSPSRLSHHVSRMEQRGLVTREDCKTDLRGANVALTDAGWDAIRAAAPDHVESVRTHLIDLLDEDELSALVSIGHKVAQHFGEACTAQAEAEDRAARAATSAAPATASPGPACPTAGIPADVSNLTTATS